MDNLDVNTYTDAELYHILDINNPTDRELEARILLLIDQCNAANDVRLAQFFSDVYDYFFDPAEDSTQNTPLYEGFTSPTDDPTTVKTAADNAKYAEELKTAEKQTTEIAKVQTLDYSPDKLRLNPLLKQTIKRVISIDSQYRDKTAYKSSTNFTFDLSEPLRDVVSLKLYSIQIPYTWYTVSKNFGANFVYLKGATDGIDNGQHDYQIKITPGNYNASADLIGAIQASLLSLRTTYPDVSWGSTALTYSSTAAKSTFVLDIQKTYTEAYYNVVFPSWSSIATQESRNQTIPAYLGFNHAAYEPFRVDSLQTTATTSFVNSQSSQGFAVDSSNNYFTVVQYDGSQQTKYSPSTPLLSPPLNTYTIYMSTSATAQQIPATGTYTRDQIVEYVNNGIQLTNLFDPSSAIYRIDNPQSVNLENPGYTYFSLRLVLNRNLVMYQPNSKICVIFPQERFVTTSVWRIQTGINSCFYFENQYNEPCEITGESALVISSYTVDPYTAIKFECISPAAFINSQNDITVNITRGRYTLNDLIAQMNANISTTQTPANVTFSAAISNPNSYFTMPIVLNKTFTNSSYQLTIPSSSVLHTNLGIPAGTYTPTSNTFIITGTFNIASGYTVDVSNNSAIFSYRPLQTGNTTGNSNDGIHDLSFNPANSVDNFISYNLYQDMIRDITNTIKNYTQDGQYLLNQTTIAYQTSSDGNSVTVSLIIHFNYGLTYANYRVRFIDADPSPTPYNIWSIFSIDASYNLSAIPNATGTGALIASSTTMTAFQNEILLYEGINNSFYIDPYPTDIGGAYTTTGANRIIITVPASIPGTAYNSDTLIAAINTQLASVPQTFGSKFDIISTGGKNYVRMRINVNLIYTTDDYNLVFYDTESFVQCYSGQAMQNVTWDSTLGWILGFRDYFQYSLTQGSQNQAATEPYYLLSESGTYYYNIVYDTASTKNQTIANTAVSPITSLIKRSIATITGDTTVNTQLYNYFLISLDDYIQNHLNDGLVTITRSVSKLPLQLPYVAKTEEICDPVTQTMVRVPDPAQTNALTAAQLYALNQAKQSQENQSKIYSAGPNIKDLFGIIPVKPGASGTTYVEFGGTLQNQERMYFGPVNIRKMTIQLLDDRGNIVDLNRSDWSFSFICEQLYKSTA
jgi:hypothetical protein